MKQFDDFLSVVDKDFINNANTEAHNEHAHLLHDDSLDPLTSKMMYDRNWTVSMMLKMLEAYHEWLNN